MRVTQSMLSSNMLHNLSGSYSKMGKLQNQIDSGKKITRPSEDPVVAMKGMGYRTTLGKVEQYQRNIGEVQSWLDTSDDTLDKVGSALQRVNELAIQAANGTNSEGDRAKIQSELDQLQQHVQTLANTKVGEKFIFSGTKTSTPLYDSATGYPAEPTDPAVDPAIPKGFEQDVKIEVYDGIQLSASTNAIGLFKSIDQMFQSIKDGTIDHNGAIKEIDTQLNRLLESRSDIGARQNRVDLMEDRLSSQEIISTKLMSENEDIDYEEAITDLITQESIHSAALSVGARIIQPSLVDFL